MRAHQNLNGRTPAEVWQGIEIYTKLSLAHSRHLERAGVNTYKDFIVMKTSFNPWLVTYQDCPAAKLRLFCFPHAGGGAHIYHSWTDDLPSRIEVCGLQLPGRENRSHEPPFTDIFKLTREIAKAIKPLSDKSYAFYGHSMGALIAYEVTRILAREQDKLPAFLFIGARRAPHIPTRKQHQVHTLDDRSIIQVVRQLEGTSSKIISDERVIDYFLPVIRADFALFEKYCYIPEEPIACPIIAFGGTLDKECSKEDIALWRQHTKGYFDMHLLSGGHFFHQHQRQNLLRIIASYLECFLALKGNEI